jgi:hypothetical protein
MNETKSQTFSWEAEMAEVRYVVAKRNGEWKITLGSSQMGPYPDRVHAIDAAIDMADRDGRDGRDSQVLVRGEDGQLRIEWTYGRDPYPEYPETLPVSSRLDGAARQHSRSHSITRTNP